MTYTTVERNQYRTEVKFLNEAFDRANKLRIKIVERTNGQISRLEEQLKLL